MVLIISALICTLCSGLDDANERSPDNPGVQADGFIHGVASGDPLADRVILWTRIATKDAETLVSGRWHVALDAELDQIVQSGEFTAGSDSDFTVKIDVKGLLPNTIYYYAFTTPDYASIIGKTRTLPAGATDQVTFAVVTCADYRSGYFNAYGRIAERDDLQAVIHLGDYIYEYGAKTKASAQVSGRYHEPETETYLLEHYRARYAQYHSDPQLKELRQKHPLIVVWDDHEFANDAYLDGAENHQPEDEGTWDDRIHAAKKAYFEWMPIRERDDQEIYRSFQIGDLASLIMIDTRIAGRDQPMAYGHPDLAKESRSNLGDEQRQWLFSQLRDGSTQWKLIGNQVIFSPMNVAFISPDSPNNMDTWDGFPAERKRVLDFIEQNNPRDIVVLTGDYHSAFATELMRNPQADDQGKPLAVELVTPSVTARNFDEDYPADEVEKMTRSWTDARYNPHFKWADLSNNGYLILTVSKSQLDAEFFFVHTVRELSAKQWRAKNFTVRSGSSRLEVIDP